MNYVICVPDGCADEPLEELGGQTPLQAASMPVLGKLAFDGEVGRAAVIPEGLPPGSDVGNMSIFGYDPTTYHTGRAPIEAAALGLRLEPDQVAYRCNLVKVGDDGTMLDFAGGHPSTERAAEVIAELDAVLGGDGVKFYPGVQYRHCMVAPSTLGDAACVPPHDLSDKPSVLPTGPGADRLIDLMERSRAIVSASGLDANQIWLWGQGPQPQLPSFESTYGLRAGLVTAVDLVRGLGVLAGVDAVDVAGATGWYDTNYEGKRDAAIEALGGETDLFIVHVEATDEAGHAGNLDEKIKALENWDSRILAGLIDGLNELGEWRLLLLPDHATPVRLKTHTPDPVPYLITGSGVEATGREYTEASVADLDPIPGHHLISKLLTA